MQESSNDIRLLLAEDDAMLATLLKVRLTKEGYEVVLCSNGREMKEQIQMALPDVIVSDIMMPYFSGIELVDYVRNELESNVPIIIISSAGNEQNVLSAFDLGANDFLSKPVSPSELVVRLKRQISKV